MDDSQGRSFIERRHPEYVKSCGEWSRYQAAYSGGREYGRDALVQYTQEPRKAYESRKQHMFPVNYCGFFVDTRASYLARKEPEISGCDNLMLPGGVVFTEDIDRRSTSLHAAIRPYAIRSAVFGNPWILVDSPRRNVLRDDGTPWTTADDAAMNHRPYWVLLNPDSVLNWELNDAGALAWALIKQPPEQTRLDESSLTVGSVVSERIERGPAYVLWTPTTFYDLDQAGKILNEGVNRAGVVPLLPLRFKTPVDDGFLGASMLTDIEPLNRELINVFSLLMQKLYHQTFSFISASYGSLALNGTRNSGVNGEAVAGIDPKLGDTLAHEAGDKPEILSYDTTGGQLLLASIDTLIKEMMRLASLAKGAAVEGQSAASGLAHAFEFLDTNQALRDQAQLLADTLEGALRITASIMGVACDPRVTFPQDFGIETAGDVIARFNTLTQSPALPPMEMIVAYYKKIVAAEFDGLTQTEKEYLLNSIEALAYPPPAPPPRTTPEIAVPPDAVPDQTAAGQEE